MTRARPLPPAFALEPALALGGADFLARFLGFLFHRLPFKNLTPRSYLPVSVAEPGWVTTFQVSAAGFQRVTTTSSSDKPRCGVAS